MKRLYLRIGVAAFAFFLGVAISSTWSRFQWNAERRSSSLNSSPYDDAWHRLYEAAGMSGDATIIAEVHHRLLCTNSVGVPDAMLVESGCQKNDGSIHQINPNNSPEYGWYCSRITHSHASWALQNLDFVRSIISAKRAKEYVARHEWPPDK